MKILFRAHFLPAAQLATDEVPLSVVAPATRRECPGEGRDILRAYDLGVNSFIVKPVTFKSLVDLTLAFSKYWFEIVELPRTEAA